MSAQDTIYDRLLKDYDDKDVRQQLVSIERLWYYLNEVKNISGGGGGGVQSVTGTWVNTGLASYGWRSVSIYGTNMIACSSNGGVWTNFGSGWVQESLSTGYNWSGVSITINNNIGILLKSIKYGVD